jgi:D-glycero-alpha-D-manno-heptose 1-phosphate guanylyltransferase
MAAWRPTVRVVGFAEKGQAGPGLINAGLYRLDRAAFGDRRAGEAFSLEWDIMPALARNAAIAHAVLDARFTDIGVPEAYHRFRRQHG